MIIGTAEITRTQINVKLHEKYAKLNAKDATEQIKKSDYIEDSSTNTNDYEKLLNKYKSERLNISIPKDPDEAIAKLDQIRKLTVSNTNTSASDKNIVMGINLMKMKLQLQELNTNQS